MDTWGNSHGSWPAYIRRVAADATQKEIAEAAGVDQTTASRWLRGAVRPTNAANVAAFALAYGRSPLEAFVAAGLLDQAAAEEGLAAASLELLAQLEDGGEV